MESARDPLPADVSAEPEPADPPPAEPLPPGDTDLIAASRAGDAAAYDTLYRRHVASAHSLARQLVRNRAEADDVVAETFAKILDLLHRGGGPDDAFRPYLLTAVRRSAGPPTTGTAPNAGSWSPTRWRRLTATSRSPTRPSRTWSGR